MSKHPNPDPPAYPRCATCKHYHPEDAAASLTRLEDYPSTKDDPPFGWCDQINGAGEVAVIDCGCHGNLKVDANFGCVLHSEITG